MSFSIDRDETLNQPSLAEMTKVALEALDAATKGSNKGFFLLIEGSKIDLASHSNDPVTHVHEVLAYNAAFKLAQEFIDRVGGVLISTSDHETGGISVGRQVGRTFDYFWYPSVLANASHSTEFLGKQVSENSGSRQQRPQVDFLDDNLRSFIEKTILEQGLGIVDASDDEIELLISRRAYPVWTEFTLAEMISLRAGIGVVPTSPPFPLLLWRQF